jgi:hypothetical protein
MWTMLVSFSVLASKSPGDDPLDRRRFTAGLTGIKNGVVAKKMISDLICFSSEFIRRKYGFKWMPYRITHDASYTDHTGADVRLLKLQAVTTDEKNRTVYLDFTVLEWDLDGTIKMTRNDKLYVSYDVAGREKGGKPKKVRCGEEPVGNEVTHS